MLPLEAKIRLEPQRPEIALELAATGEMPRAVAFPQPFATDKEIFLILPMNEGISYPAADRPSSRPTTISMVVTACAWLGTGRRTDGRE